MGRELKRKQAKKEGRKIEKEVEVNDLTLKKFGKILFYAILIAGFVYLFAAVFKTKEFAKNETKKETENSSTKETNTILASDSLSKSGEYYVYYYDYSEKINSIETNLTNHLSTFTIYRVNVKDGFNSNYVSETTNPNAKTINELKVASPTLIKVVNNEIVAYYEGKEAINNFLGE